MKDSFLEAAIQEAEKGLAEGRVAVVEILDGLGECPVCCKAVEVHP